jgi:hypothetical protein
VVLSFLYLIRHKNNFTSHVVVVVVVVVVDDADYVVVFFFFYDSSAHFWVMVSPLLVFRATNFLRGEDFITHA